MAKWTKRVLGIFKYICHCSRYWVLYSLLHFHFAVKWAHEIGFDQRAIGEQDECQIQAKAREKKAETF